MVITRISSHGVRDVKSMAKIKGRGNRHIALSTIRGSYDNSPQQRIDARLVWKATPEEALQECSVAYHAQIQMLVNTGSMTQQLENLVQSAIVVDRTSVAELDMAWKWDAVWTPSMTEPLIERQIVLRVAETNDPVLYALSRWEPSMFRKIMTHPERSMWDNLQMNGIQTTRHIHSIFALDAPELQTHLGEMDGHKEWLLVLPGALNRYVQ